MRAHEQEFLAKGAALAAVSLGDAQYAKVFRTETGLTFPLLIDEKKKGKKEEEKKGGRKEGKKEEEKKERRKI